MSRGGTGDRNGHDGANGGRKETPPKYRVERGGQGLRKRLGEGGKVEISTRQRRTDTEQEGSVRRSLTFRR